MNKKELKERLASIRALLPEDDRPLVEEQLRGLLADWTVPEPPRRVVERLPNPEAEARAEGLEKELAEAKRRADETAKLAAFERERRAEESALASTRLQLLIDLGKITTCLAVCKTQETKSPPPLDDLVRAIDLDFRMAIASPSSSRNSIQKAIEWMTAPLDDAHTDNVVRQLELGNPPPWITATLDNVRAVAKTLYES